MSIFPSVPEITEEEIQEEREIKPVGRSFKFNFDTGQFEISNGQVKETTELEAIEQWIQLCLQTYTDKFNTYKNTGFGCNIEDIIGVKLDAFYESELRREIEEALLKNEQIENVNNIRISQEGITIILDIEISLYNKELLSLKSKIL